MTQESLLNPALELYDMWDPWRITPAGKTVLQARGGSDEYWPVHSRANQLLDEIERYLSERAIVSNRPVAGRTNMEALRTAVSAPGLGLGHSQSVQWQAIPDGPMEWLDSLGQNWDRSRLVTHAAELKEVVEVAQLISSDLSKMVGLDATHKEYLITLCDAVRSAARSATVDGEGKTARLAAELVGALSLFVPEPHTDTKGLFKRMEKAARVFTIYYLAPTAVQLTANPAVIAALEPPPSFGPDVL